MKFIVGTQLAAVLAVFAAGVQCAPTASAAGNQPSEIFKRANHCTESSFINQSSEGSPFIQDCQQMAHNIRNGGDWGIATWKDWNKVTKHKSCAFSAKLGETNDRAWIIKIGNEDIRDIVASSIEQFAWDGRVGAKGDMKCSGEPMAWSIHWNK